ncbi:hypothetical protein, partial [uncultured Phascolarctobacterium sp.]|uniref:hypothetical protein n=2 Tax=uncultured Phascolarctobacterium sp. TaxID=512296 RepID=UPI00262E49FC
TLARTFVFGYCSVFKVLLAVFDDLYIIAFPVISVNTFFVTFFIFFDDTPGSVGKAFRLTTSHFPVIFSQNFISLALSSIQKRFYFLCIPLNSASFCQKENPVLPA